MAQDVVGEIGEFFSHLDAEGAYVGDQMEPIFKVAVFLRAGGGLTVAQVVVAADGKALLGQEPGKGLIALDILTDAVDQLYHAPGRPFGKPKDGVDLVRAVGGGKEELLGFHREHTFLLYNLRKKLL